MIRLTVPLETSWRSPSPGTYYYIMVFGQGNFWESHPFTVASSSTDKEQAELVELQEEASPLLGPVSPGQTTSTADDTKISGDDMSNSSSNYSGHMTFLIRPYDSFTSRLRNLAQTHEPKAATVRLAVDGPYGKTLPLEIFDNVVFIVGGSGIVLPLSYMKLLTSSPSSSSSSTTRPRAIHLHWAVRQTALALDVLDNDLRHALECENVHIHVHVTGDSSHSVVDDESSRRAPHRVTWNPGRVRSEEAIGDALRHAHGRSLAVVACGPARVADDCRRVTAEHMASSKLRIEYFEESFQW